jgi:hypothetical protein
MTAQCLQNAGPIGHGRNIARLQAERHVEVGERLTVTAKHPQSAGPAVQSHEIGAEKQRLLERGQRLARPALIEKQFAGCDAIAGR